MMQTVTGVTETFEAVVRGTDEHYHMMWETIRAEIPSLQPEHLADLKADLDRLSAAPTSSMTFEVLEDWYHRVLSMRAQREKPVEPVRSTEEFEALPSRSF